MKREDAINAGVVVHEIKHSMKRRTPWHDYSRRGTYMLTLVVNGRAALLGTLKGHLAGETAPYVECSELGAVIKNDEIRKIHYYYPQVEVWKICIMPDHLHMIVRVKEDMGEGKHLGYVIRGFKAGCTKAWWKLAGAPATPMTGVKTPGTVATLGTMAMPGTMTTTAGTMATAGTVAAAGTVATAGTVAMPGTMAAAGTVAASGATVPEVLTSAKRQPLFEEGYCDKILMHERQLENWKHYLDDNPRRLLVKRQNPGLFTVLCGMEVVGEPCQGVGNRFLLDIPDKMAVIVHRRYTDEENARLREEWLACGERGGVLVSAAISPKEKEVLREAMNRGYRIILLRENGFPKLYKPSGETFDACAEGLLLQISPWEFHMEKKVITRAQCLHLNAMAERIVDHE